MLDPHPKKQQRGQMVVILALAIVPLIGIVSLAVDAGRAFVDARALQNAVDGAALAGAQDIDSSPQAVGTSYNPSKARMEAMVFLARNLGILDQLSSGSCGSVSLTPNYNSVPASYGSDVSASNCSPAGGAGVRIGAYQIAIYQPPSADSVNAGNPYAIEIEVTDNVPTTLARVLGFTSLPVHQRAVAGTTSGRWTVMTLRHYAGNNQSDVTLSAATLDVINGDVATNAGLRTTSNGNTPAIVNWWFCNPRQYGGGGPPPAPQAHSPPPRASAPCPSSAAPLYKLAGGSSPAHKNPSNTPRALPTHPT